jgi:murein DD-endopeptidase MepM/ murein hydrolase activator NlpD
MIWAVCLSSGATHALGPFHVDKHYGDRAPYGDGSHPGIDFSITTGSPIIAVSDGTVSRLHNTVTDGEEVVINHGKYFRSIYAHLSQVFVRKDQVVKRGQLIALSGASNNYGKFNNNHLHFGICKYGGGCRLSSETYDPNVFWLGGQPQCFDPNMDYSAYSQKDIILPIACGDYGKALIAGSTGKD